MRFVPNRIVCVCVAAHMVLCAASAFAATPDGDDIVLYAANATAVQGAAWSRVADATAASGARMLNRDAGAAKIGTAAASPASYFELTFTPQAGRAYRLWVRGKAAGDSYRNDSAYIQFSGSVTASGSPVFRIGTTSATWVGIEQGSGQGLSGWGWADNGYDAVGAPLYFDGSPETMRIQQREDGVSFDQIVLSPVTYWTEAPGAPKNDTTILPASGTTTTTTTTTTTSQPPPNGEVVLYARRAATVAGAWSVVADATAAGGARMANANAGKAKVSTAAASPASYFELSFTAEAGRPYRLWMRGKAASDSYQNDSAFVQFSGSVDSAGRPQYRIGTTDATWVGIEQGASQGLHGWGWSDNGYDCLGPLIYFDGTPQTIRIQVREDGLSIDQIVLSPAAYLATAPGAAKSDTTILAETAGASDGGSSDGGSTGSGTTSGSGSSGNPDNQTAALRILQWNTHHGGFGTDGKYDTNRLASWIVKMAPDVVMLNEIEKFTSWGNQNQPEVYKALLEQKTGKTWYYLFAQEYGNWTANGKGNLILSTVPFTYTNRYELVHNGDRSVAEATITWNGRPITLVLTHLDPDSQALRLTQATEVTTYASAEPENRVLTGDMNAWPDQTSIAKFDTAYIDSWVAATALGKAVAFAGNAGQTKNGRIDYIFLSKGSTALSVVSSQVYDTRDANGIMPSDHRPVLTTFAVR